jgi:hypothetical protein
MKLTALRPDNPIAWMAACGPLRLLPGARLRWTDEAPEVDFDGDVLATLAGLLPDRVASPEVQFRTKLGATMDDAAWQGIKALPKDWTLALGTQTASGMSCTSLKMRPGDHDMLGDTRSILGRLAKSDLQDKLAEALLGPWRYEDSDCVAWGWDAEARLDAAAIGTKAEKAPKYGVLAAYWLGWEALPVFPMINGVTVGWSDGLTYPTWSQPLEYREVKALMIGLDRLRPTERRALGVRVWFARYLKTHASSGRLGWAAELTRSRSAGTKPRGSRNVQATETMIV